MRHYHEVTKAIADAYYMVEREKNVHKRAKRFDEMEKLVVSLFAAISKQYNLRYENDFQAPPLSYNAPIVGVAEHLLNELEAWRLALKN